MKNPLVALVEKELSRLGGSEIKLVGDSYSPDSFGDAEAVYELRNVRLRIIRNRSEDTVSVGSSRRPGQLFSLEDVAVWMGWISLDDILKQDGPIDFSRPPPGPIFALPAALELIVKDMKKLDKAFSLGELFSTYSKLQSIEGKRVAATFG